MLRLFTVSSVLLAALVGGAQPAHASQLCYFVAAEVENVQPDQYYATCVPTSVYNGPTLCTDPPINVGLDPKFHVWVYACSPF